MRWRNADARPGERPFRRNFASDLASATLPPPPGERDMGERDVASATWASATWRARRHPPTGERHFVIATSRSPSSTKRPIGTSRRCAHEPVRHAPGPIGTAPSARESRPLGRQHPLNTTRARANARVQGHRVCATGARRSTVLASNPGVERPAGTQRRRRGPPPSAPGRSRWRAGPRCAAIALGVVRRTIATGLGPPVAHTWAFVGAEATRTLARRMRRRWREEERRAPRSHWALVRSAELVPSRE